MSQIILLYGPFDGGAVESSSITEVGTFKIAWPWKVSEEQKYEVYRLLEPPDRAEHQPSAT